MGIHDKKNYGIDNIGMEFIRPNNGAKKRRIYTGVPKLKIQYSGLKKKSLKELLVVFDVLMGLPCIFIWDTSFVLYILLIALNFFQ